METLNPMACPRLYTVEVADAIFWEGRPDIANSLDRELSRIRDAFAAATVTLDLESLTWR